MHNLDDVTVTKAKEFFALGLVEKATVLKPNPLLDKGFTVVLKIANKDYPLMGVVGEVRSFKHLGTAMTTLESIGFNEFTVKG